MEKKTYSIFGAGAAGLYTAWRLLNGKTESDTGKKKQLGKGDVLELCDWGAYDFSRAAPGTRAPGARVCTWFYQNDKSKSYVEVGGMRYSQWDSTAPGANGGKAPGHRVVTTVIAQLGLDRYAVPFNESTNPLFYLRSKNMYLSDISSKNPAPYNADHFAATAPPDQGFAVVEGLAVTSTSGPQTRTEWDEFYQHGRITAELPSTSVFQKGDLLKDIGYWDLMYDQLGGEGYNYAADGNGYSSNVINWNAAVAFEANNEFTPGNQYSTLTLGYSSIFAALFDAVAALAGEKGVDFKYYPNTRLHSIFVKDAVIHYTFATRERPWESAGARTTAAAWLAMPRHSIELVAQATRFQDRGGILDVLNAQRVRLYLEAAIMQPSYKVGMFFDSPWWVAPTATYPAQLTSYVVTDRVIQRLRQQQFPEPYLVKLSGPAVLGVAFASTADFIKTVEGQIEARLSVPQEQQLLTVALCNTIGPSVTDTPIRQAVYFGNNAADQSGSPIYGMLASYDDETFTTFWRELELGPMEQRHVPTSEDVQTLEGPRKVPAKMVKMLRRQLAELHFGPNADYSYVPEPLEARYMDWSLPPFNAGYHAWAAHYDIADVQQKIRKPSQLVGGADADIFIVGEAYSNDQAWVEGAFCTAESVLNDFFDIEPIIDNTHYPFICQPKRA